MPKKFKATWKAGSEYLPPFTIKESVNTLLQADKMLGEGTMSYDEAYELIIQFREMNGNPYEGMISDEIDKEIVDQIKKELKDAK